MGDQTQQVVEHGQWLDRLPIDVPEVVDDWELQTSHGKDYIETEMFIPDEFVEWKLRCEFPYYLQLIMNEYPIGTVYSLEIERPLGGTQLLDGRSTSENPTEIVKSAIVFMESVKGSDVKTPFYGGSWFPSL